MKSASLQAKTAPGDQADNWLQSIRDEQGQSLRAAFSHGQLKRRTELAIAFTAGAVIGIFLLVLAFVSAISVVHSVYALGLVSTVGVVVSLVFMRAAVRAFLESTEYQKRASSSIVIVQNDDPIESPKPETATPAPPN